VSEHVGVIFIVNFVLLFVFYCILLSAFVGKYTEHMNMHGMSNITFVENIFVEEMKGKCIS
jgi:hypothetical protein